MLNLAEIKSGSEQYILANGGTVCDWLPVIDFEEISPRDAAEVAARALALNMLVNVSFGAPIRMAGDWLEKYGLTDALSHDELKIIESSTEPDESACNYLRWNIEALWSAVWIGGLSDELLPVQGIADTLASRFPSLKDRESPENFLGRFSLRDTEEIYKKLDLFYRSHWYARDCQCAGKDFGVFHPGVIQQRRHMLEWVMHPGVAWDKVDLST